MNKEIHPDLEDRFQQPEGWRWHHFERQGHKIRFGCVTPKDSIPDAVIVCLQGVREFTEKYYELARWATDNNLSLWMMDWAGQGKSSRFLKHAQKRHSEGFDDDIEDLHYFIMEYIKHSSVHPDKGRIPMVMLAHSMGGNVGLQYLSKYPDIFECAAFTAPMTGIKVFHKLPQKLALLATTICNSLFGKCYVPGGADWGKREDHVLLSHDQVRKNIQNAWCAYDSELQTGDVTFGWVHHAQKACINIQSPSKYAQISVPCLFALAGEEQLVDNAMTEKIIGGIHNTRVVHYPGAGHEILMEQNEIRDDFLNHFYNFIEEYIISRPETLKPF